jgi:glutaconate CoA-transferase subunit A
MSPPNKVMTLRQAAELVPEKGATLALGGVTLYRRPMAFSLALAARYRETGKPKALTLLSFTAGLESDLLIASDMVSRMRSCYVGLESFGLAPSFTHAAGQGNLEIVEETEASLALGMRATMAGVGFMPSTAWQGTDLLSLRPDVRSIRDPYSGETLTAFPAIHADVAVIHALAADSEGNAQIGRNWGVDRELALIADTVIVTAEEIRPELDTADIIAPSVKAVVLAPKGAWPTSCHPLYPFDGQQVLRYVEDCLTERFPGLLAAWSEKHRLSA